MHDSRQHFKSIELLSETISSDSREFQITLIIFHNFLKPIFREFSEKLENAWLVLADQGNIGEDRIALST
jgi:hypothetical protein